MDGRGLTKSVVALEMERINQTQKREREGEMVEFLAGRQSRNNGFCG